MGSGCSTLDQNRIAPNHHEESGSDEEDYEEEEEAPVSVVPPAAGVQPQQQQKPKNDATRGPLQTPQQQQQPQAPQNSPQPSGKRPTPSSTPQQSNNPLQPQSAAPAPPTEPTTPLKRSPQQPSYRPPTTSTSTTSNNTTTAARTPAPPASSPTHAPSSRRRPSPPLDASDFQAPIEQQQHVASISASNSTAPTADDVLVPTVAAPSPQRSVTTHSGQRSSSITMASPPPPAAAPQPDPWNDDLTTELPRQWQNKAIRTLALVHTSLSAPMVQPAVVFGALGDMRGERVDRSKPVFSLRSFMTSAPIVLSFRLAHMRSQYLEHLAAQQSAVNAAVIGDEKAAAAAAAAARGGIVPLTVGFGSKVSAPAMTMLLSGPHLFQQEGRNHRTQTNKPVLHKMGMHTATLWMPSTLRKGNRRRQRSQFPYQREVVSVMTAGQDAAACFVAHLLPDILINLQVFEGNVRQGIKASFRTVLHKLFDTVVQRYEQQSQQKKGGKDIMEGSGYGRYGQSNADYSHLRAPRVDVSLVYIRDDDIYACTTIGAPEAQLFCLLDTKGKQVIPLDSDSVGESVRSNDERSISSMGSSASMASSRSGGGGRRKSKHEVKRTYDMPALTTFFCPIADISLAVGQDMIPTNHLSTDASQGGGGGSAQTNHTVRMATFSSQPYSEPLTTPSSSSRSTPPTWRPKVAVVLATESFWHTLSKKEVWDLLYIMTELNVEASTRRSIDKSAMDLVKQHRGDLAESTATRLMSFFQERREAAMLDIPTMPEGAMAQVLCDVAEAKATIENTDNASRMSATVITIA
ncbi:Hypothetical protein, putative [Bodo saltans]|uniref:Uncharacterized protein n=1 Tax=Bodo saltans TaxID=75058 RepID=A0A0S4IYS5_BODSA|nr:Hypothetical protein, putative [Bodo saltans]|eukprot:CUG22767.1 Hypothetical protein, putative [Bodo saltans]